MGNSVGVLRSHYINRLVTRDTSAKCWRVLEAVEAKLARCLEPEREPIGVSD